MNIGNLEGVTDLRGRLYGSESYAVRPLSDLGPNGLLKFLVIHHTATQDDVSAKSIARYHAETLGWPGIGYHFLVHQDGVTEYVGDILTVRHNVAKRNHEVIGVCLPGDFMRHSPITSHLEAARLLVINLQYSLGWPVPIIGHCEAALPGFGTSCPGKSFLGGPRWKDRLTGANA